MVKNRRVLGDVHRNRKFYQGKSGKQETEQRNKERKSCLRDKPDPLALFLTSVFSSNSTARLNRSNHAVWAISFTAYFKCSAVTRAGREGRGDPRHVLAIEMRAAFSGINP